MSLDRTRTAKALIELSGNKPNRYVPGSLRILPGGSIDWTEKCSPRCPHDNECHMARWGSIPTGYVDAEVDS